MVGRWMVMVELTVDVVRQLVLLAREQGVAVLKVGSLEIVLGPPPLTEEPEPKISTKEDESW